MNEAELRELAGGRRIIRKEGSELTERQRLVNQTIMAGDATHILLRGGGRSGKTYLIMRALVTRAMRAPRSTHAVLRFRFNHLKESIIDQTLPAVMENSFPGVQYKINRSDWYFRAKGSGKILFGGLDDKERTEKILGQEHSSIFLNECSQIPYGSRNKSITRLSQKSGLKLRCYYDENPPSKGHWTYSIFFRHIEPITKKALVRPDDYATAQMNPDSNLAHISQEYMEILRSLPEKDQRRFLFGEFQEEAEGALWDYDMLEARRIDAKELPDLAEVVVAVDPSGCEGPDDHRSDEVGIVVVARGVDGMGYLLEDASGKFGPAEWGRIVVKMYRKWGADYVVGERNFGGAMVENTIRMVDAAVSFIGVTASRGKAVRAAPVAALYSKHGVFEIGRIRHVCYSPELEDQLCAFTPGGFVGERSPDRADAMVWGFSKLFVDDLAQQWISHYANLAKSGNGTTSKPPSVVTGEPEPDLAKVYKDTYARAMGDQTEICELCKQPVVGQRITDGFVSRHVGACPTLQ